MKYVTEFCDELTEALESEPMVERVRIYWLVDSLVPCVYGLVLQLLD